METYGLFSHGAHHLGIGAFNPTCLWIHLHKVVPIAYLFQYCAYLGIRTLSSLMELFAFKLTMFVFKFLRILRSKHTDKP